MTNFFLWALAGCAAGWIGFAVMGFNRKRGLLTSIIIGMAGGLVGGNLLAPMLSTGIAVNPSDFNPFPLVIAFAFAAACLIVSSMVHKRFGF